MNLLAALIGATVIAAATRLFWNGWQQRGITTSVARDTVVRLQLVIGTCAAIPLALADISAPDITAALGATLALGVVAIFTDLHSAKIPKEPCLVAIGFGLIAYATTGGPEQWGIFNLAVALTGLALVPFIAAMLTKGGLGFGDIRLLTAFACTLSWWVGYEALLWGVITACILQGLVRLATRLRHAPKLPFGPALVIGVTAWTGAALMLA